MIPRLAQWFGYKWRRLPSHDLAQAYHATFSTPTGQLVLQHMLDEIYCKVYEGNDPQLAAALNSRRTVVDEILYMIDVGEHPEKYRNAVEMEALASSGALDNGGMVRSATA